MNPGRWFVWWADGTWTEVQVWARGEVTITVPYRRWR